MFRRHAPIEPRLDGGLSGSHTGTVDSHVDCVQFPDQPPKWQTTHAAASCAVYKLGMVRSAGPAGCQNMLQLFRPINHRA